MKHLEDNFGRKFPYIRMSITEVCNFKCGYCLPNGYQADKSDNRKFLNIDEIRRLAKGFSELGVQKIRLTGGEPTVRKDFFEIIKILKNETDIKKIVITTNGYHLDKKAKKLVDSGLNGINISIDSLDREVFKNITGHDRLIEILKGIQDLQDLNFEKIKINAVLLKNINASEKDFDAWGDFIKKNKVDLRYIELMQTGDNFDYFKKYHVPAAKFTNYLIKAGKITIIWALHCLLSWRQGRAIPWVHICCACLCQKWVDDAWRSKPAEACQIGQRSKARLQHASCFILIFHQIKL